MSQESGAVKPPSEKFVRNIRRATGKRCSPEQANRIVLEGLRGKDSIGELCRRESISQNLYYHWSKEFLEAGKKRLAGDMAREATSGEVTRRCAGCRALKDVAAELMLENRLIGRSISRINR